jgi:hypothetical protein
LQAEVVRYNIYNRCQKSATPADARRVAAHRKFENVVEILRSNQGGCVMAKDRTGKRSEPPSQNPLAELNKFLTGFVELTSQIPNGILAQSTDPDDKALVAAYAAPLNEQVGRLTDYIRQKAGSTSKQGLEEIGAVLRMMAANTLVENGMRVAQNLTTQTAKIALSDIINLIKKIIRVIIAIFNITVPNWFWPLIELIDEIINFLISLGLIRLASTLSRRHQDYMSELTHLMRLQREAALAGNNGEDEDEE